MPRCYFWQIEQLEGSPSKTEVLVGKLSKMSD